MKTCPHAEGNFAIDSVVSILKLKYFLIQKRFALKQKDGGWVRLERKSKFNVWRPLNKTELSVIRYLFCQQV